MDVVGIRRNFRYFFIAVRKVREIIRRLSVIPPVFANIIEFSSECKTAAALHVNLKHSAPPSITGKAVHDKYRNCERYRSIVKVDPR